MGPGAEFSEARARAAIEEGRADLIRAWLEQGRLDPEGRVSFGQRQIDFAAALGREQIVRAYLEAGAKWADEEEGMPSALAWAAQEGRLECCGALLEAGADPNHADESGDTPLRGAAERGGWRAARLLLEAGADPNRIGEFGRTALHWAAEARKGKAVAALLEFGADPRMRDKEGDLPEDIALAEGEEELAQWLQSARLALEESERLGREVPAGGAGKARRGI